MRSKRDKVIACGIRQPETIARFWRSVNKSDGCWEWLGLKTNLGYGTFSICDCTISTHRFSWSIAHDAVPPVGLFVCHHCDNPSCVRPSHLFLGTNSDNMADMCAKGRAQVGEANSFSVLTEVAVRDIRARLKTEAAAAIARSYGVSNNAVYSIKHGRTWKHVT